MLFDLDGTLVNSTEAHAESFVRAFREAGFRVTLADVRKLIGISGMEIVERITGERRKDIFNRKVELFLQSIDLLREVPHASEVLDSLRERFGLGLVTSSDRRMTEAVLDRFGWEFDVVVTASDVERAKPEPQMLAVAVEKLGGPAVYVGDTLYDRQMAGWCGVTPLILGEDLGSLRELLTLELPEAHLPEGLPGVPVTVGPVSRVMLIARGPVVGDRVSFSPVLGAAEGALSLIAGTPLKEVRFLDVVRPGEVVVASAREGTVRVTVKDRVVMEGSCRAV